MAYSRDFGRIFRNMDYLIELKRLLFKLFRITKFRTRSDKCIRSSILSKLKKELASHFARCGLTDRSVAIQILTLLMWQNFVFTSQSHKVAYFYDVGSNYAIDKKINHLHNDRVANMWRNNVPSVCGRG